MMNLNFLFSKKSFLWFLPIFIFILPLKKNALDTPEITDKLPTTRSQSGMPYNPNGRFRSPFANPNFGEPCKVKIGFLLKNIASYSIKEGKFEADFFISYTSDKAMPKNVKPMFTNGILEDDDLLITIADEPTFKLWKIHATFYSQPDLRNYPFDTQELNIQIEENNTGIDQINFIADQPHTSLDAGFNIPGWEVDYLEARILNHYYPDRFEFDDLYYPRYIFRLGISRFSTNAIFTVFIPAFIIVLVSLSGIWLTKAEIDTRINSSAPMLAAAVFFHYSIGQELPATPYLTRADKLMMAVYIGLIMNMFATWAFFFFHEKHDDRIYKWGKLLVPPLNLVLYILGCIL